MEAKILSHVIKEEVTVRCEVKVPEGLDGRSVLMRSELPAEVSNVVSKDFSIENIETTGIVYNGVQMYIVTFARITNPS